MADLIKRYTRQTQLNERVSETQYDVIHPETHADLVITTEQKQFVSAADKERWDAGEGSAHYKGLWDSTVRYVPGDIVKDDNGYFYVAVTTNTNIAPNPEVKVTLSGITQWWHNLSYISNIADKTEKIKTSATNSDSKYYVTFVDSNNTTADYESVYSDAGVSYNPSTNTLTVSRLEGTADKALEANHAKEADHAAEADHATLADEATTAHNYFIAAGNTPNIHTTIEGINKRIDDLTNGTGGAVLSNKLFIQKNGSALNPNGFDGSTEQTVNITIVPADVTGLLDSNSKIDSKWLPDSILGNLKYGGTVNENGVITSSNSSLSGANINDLNSTTYSGYYFLAAFTNSTASATLAGVADVRVGDWVVSNGIAGWVKVDNTDAVTMVNSQIGNIETYKGDWTTNTQYYRGDIVKYNGALYVANKESRGTAFDTTAFDIFGKVYTASKGIKLDGNDIQHDVNVVPGTSSEENLNYGSAFTVPSLTTDAYGHVTKVDLKTLTLPAAVLDTWRKVVVNGTEILDTSVTSGPLSLNSGNLVNVTFENNVVKFDHEETGYDAGSFDAEKVVTLGDNETDLVMGNGFKVPTFEYDAYGHIKNVVGKTYRLPNSTIAHSHYDVVTVNGLSTIQAFSATKATTTWVNDANNTAKYYLGNVNPVKTTRMNFNGNLVARNFYQVEGSEIKRVLDAGLTINSGANAAGLNTESTYNEATNTITLGDTGVEAGVYSAVSVNTKGLVNGGGQIVEFGQEVNAGPSDALVIGGLFFRRIEAN